MAMATHDLITPEYRAERARLHALRKNIEVGLQSMIDLLDMLDAPGEDKEDEEAGPEEDPDLELSLGWSANGAQTRLGQPTDDGDKTAPEHYGAGFVRCALDDHEPSLGSLGSCSEAWGQIGWARGNTDDREQAAGDEGEPDTDQEPALGASHDDDQQVAWAVGCEDTGIADEDALAEFKAEMAEPAPPWSPERSEGLKAARKEALAQLRAKAPGRMPSPDAVVFLGPGEVFYRGRRIG